jgi:hypothetical protein
MLYKAHQIARKTNKMFLTTYAICEIENNEH